jgi:glycosyltransferase involved in cell wall biosynthesis
MTQARKAEMIDTGVVPASEELDLARFAPEADLLKTEASARLKRFRRFHRLGVPCLLFVGPYTKQGGLDIAIQAAFRLREQFEDLRLATIPVGPVDQRFLDDCEMQALGLGHRGIVEWTVEQDELPFWFATSSIVCSPGPECAPVQAGARLAAAAGRPFVGGDIAPLGVELAAEKSWVTLVPPGNVDALVDACSLLLGNPEDAALRGAAARARAEERFGSSARAPAGPQIVPG